MGVTRRVGFASFVLAAILAGCTGPQAGLQNTSAERTPPESRASLPKRITVALPGDVTVLARIAVQGGASSSAQLQELFNAGPAMIDDQALPRPQLAEAVPTVDNGLWKLFPDGRMETTWKLRSGIKWHDDTPFTTGDLLFTALVEGDRSVPRASRSPAYEALEGIEALDSQTVVLKWNSPFIDADKIFSSLSPYAMPMPRHILESAYLQDKATYFDHPYWSREFVGTGPFRLREYAPGSHLLLDANPDYILGRPNIDEIEIKVTLDANARVANILAGTIDLGISQNNTLSTEQAIQVREHWRAGRVEFAAGDWVRIMPQFLDPTPAIVGNLQFRRAMYHAIDRQQMVDTLVHGLSNVMYSFLAPNQPQYGEVEAPLTRYEYDPRKAVQMMEGLGYVREAGGFFRDANGQLAVELRTVDRAELGLSTQAATADGWRRIGVNVEQLVIPPQRQFDNEYRATFPGFEVIVGGPFDAAGLRRQLSSSAKTPETNFAGSATPRYKNADYDALIQRYYVTLPIGERTRVMGQIIAHYADNVVEMPMFALPQPVVIANRVTGIVLSKAPVGSMLWNAHQWDLTD